MIGQNVYLIERWPVKFNLIVVKYNGINIALSEFDPFFHFL